MHGDSDAPAMKKSSGNEFGMVQGAVDIVDHYAMNCDPKVNECSDSTQPLRPPRKYSDYSVDLPMPSSRKASENLDTSPIKPSRKLSQCSTANRKFSTASETSSIKTPKKVSFSDELPLAATAQLATTAAISSDAASAAAADSQMPLEHLTTFTHAIMDSTVLASIQHSSEEDDDDDDSHNDDSDGTGRDGDGHYSSPSSSISTQTLNELTKADMFPNSRKVSLHSERSFDMGTSTSLKPGTESATTQITTDTETAMDVTSTTPLDTFLDQERKMSTSSLKSNYCACIITCGSVIFSSYLFVDWSMIFILFILLLLPFRMHGKKSKHISMQPIEIKRTKCSEPWKRAISPTPANVVKWKLKCDVKKCVGF